MTKKLYKTRNGNTLDGVCNGMAVYFNMDPTVMRLIWVAAGLLAAPATIIGYIVCSLVVPREQ